jgi:hypothetical protein
LYVTIAYAKRKIKLYQLEKLKQPGQLVYHE